MSSKERNNTRSGTYVKGALEGAASAKHIPRKYTTLPEKMLSESTTAGIFDKTAGRIGKDGQPRGEWLLRFDRPHRGAEFPHINLNSKIIKGKDPHTRVPAALVETAGVTSKGLRYVGKGIAAASIANDAYRISDAAYRDYNELGRLGQRTAREVGSTTGGWMGGYGGAIGGQSLGGTIGGAVGATFGGVGAIPGAAVGSLVGGAIGGIGGGIAGSTVGEKLVDYFSSTEDDDDDDEEDMKKQNTKRYYKK